MIITIAVVIGLLLAVRNAVVLHRHNRIIERLYDEYLGTVDVTEDGLIALRVDGIVEDE